MGKRKKGAIMLDKDGPSSLFILSTTNPVRRLFVWFVTWPPFEWLIIITIMSNCVVMSMDSRIPNNDKTILSLQLEELEPVFMGIFTVEMCTKIVAMGFILHENSYLRNAWNIMDFIVVVSGMLTPLFGHLEGFLPMLMPKSEDGKTAGPDLSMLRTFRVLRPLKLVSGVPSLQVVMSSIAKAIGPLVNIALLLLFAIIIFAIVGLEFYSGALNKTCFDINDLNVILTEVDGGMPCAMGTEASTPVGSYICQQNESICLEKWEGPNNGITSFDNIALAMLTTFQCVTMEGWTPIMYWTNDALGSAFNWVFFIPLIVIGSFFMLNLVLGVLSGEFAKEKERVESRAGFMALKEQQRLEKELTGYVDWICRAEDLVLAEDRTTEADRELIMDARKKQMKLLKKMSFTKQDSQETNSVVTEDGGSQVDINKELWKKEKQMRFLIRKWCKTPAWFWFVIVLVFLNTCTVAVEHYNQPEWLTEFLFYCEFVFLALFVFEMGVRMYALGLIPYFQSAFNRFDCIVIFGSLFEEVWIYFGHRAGSFGISALRALRLLRVFKVTKYWSSLRNLVVALTNAISSILSLLLLLFLFIFIFALLGMQLFGGNFNFTEGRPTSNFDSITSALLTVFQILTGEDWNQVMYTAIDSKGGRQNGGMIYCLYFVLLTLCGDYTLLNVFLAIACDSLDQAAALNEAEEAEKERAEAELEKQREREALALAILNGTADKLELEKREKEENEAWAKKTDTDLEAATLAALDEKEEIPIIPYSSLFILSSENRYTLAVRKVIHWVVTKKVFDNFIMLVIVMSSVAIAAEDPVDEDNPRNFYLGKADYIFTLTFAFEVCLKILDRGFILHPGSYMRDYWNVMDIIVVSCSMVSFYHTIAAPNMFKTSTGQKLKAIKLLRVLRPLKTINRIPKLKAVFDCVIISLKNVFNILIVYILFQFIFAVVGVQLFNGKFFYCTDESKHNAQDCQGTFFVFLDMESPPVQQSRIWSRKDFHYDNCFVAMLTLFAVQTSEGWVAILQDSMSSTYEDEGPIPWFRTEQCIFYIVFFVVFPFFFVNIFVALIIVTFNELGEAELEDDMDKNQKSCIDFAIQAKPLELYVPDETTGLRYHTWRLVTSSPFENFILLLIILNTLSLMMKYHDAPLFFMDILSYFNLLFTTLFTIECGLKLFGYGPKNYFKDSWNTFDFITVVGSIIDVTKLVQIGFLKLFRAARLIKLLRRSVSVRILLYTFIQSFKALPYVCMLMGMLFFIYAIIGMQLFGSLVMDPFTAIERHNNFRHIFQSLLVLFRCATGEAWPEIMLAGIGGRPCDPKSYGRNSTTGELLMPDQSCGSDVSYVYFVSFIFLCSFIMLNLFVAVIMDNFDYLTRDSSILGSHHLGEFITSWADIDPSGVGEIHYTEALEILKNIDPPLGFGKKCPDKMAYKRLIRMNMPINKKGRVTFTTTLFALIRDNLKINVRESAEMDQADLELRATILKVWPITRSGKIDLLVPTEDSTGQGKLTVGKLYGGVLIYEIWKTTRFSNLEILAKMEEEMEEKEKGDSGDAPQKKETPSESEKSKPEVGADPEEEELTSAKCDAKLKDLQDELDKSNHIERENSFDRLEQSKSRMDQKYRDESNSLHHRGNGHAHNQRSQWDHWDGWNPNPCIDTSRNYNDWNRSNHTGILKQHSQELHNFGSSPSINKETSLDNHNRPRSRYRKEMNNLYRDNRCYNNVPVQHNNWDAWGDRTRNHDQTLHNGYASYGRSTYGQRRHLPSEKVTKKSWHNILPRGRSSEDITRTRRAWDPLIQSGHNPNYLDYNYYGGPTVNGTTGFQGDSLIRQHRQLPVVPGYTKSFAHQHSLPEEYSDPYLRESYSSKISSYLKPLVPIKPSSLSLRQSSTLNGSPSYTLIGAPHFQMPKVSDSPTVIGRTDSLVQMNGRAGEHHRTLPPVDRSHTLRRTLPQPPSNLMPHKNGGGLGGNGFGITDFFSRTNRDFDWI